MEFKKKVWKGTKKIFPAFLGMGVPVGNSCRPHPYLPSECIGKPMLTVVIMDDEELEEALKEYIKNEG